MKNLFFISIVLVLAAGLFIFSFKYKKLEKNSKDIRTVEVMDEKQKKDEQIQDMYESAIEYINAGQDKNAIKVWRTFIKEYPNSQYTPRAYYELGKDKIINKDTDIAKKYFKKLISLFPNDNYCAYAFYELAKLDEQEGDYKEALVSYKKIKEEYFFIDNIQEVIEKIDDLSIKIIFSPIKFSKSIDYEVRSGDSLYAIAKKFNTTIEFIEEANNLNKKTIHPGDRIKLLDPKIEFSLNIDKSQKTLTLNMDGEYLKKYRIAVGKNDATPIGEFKVQNKLKDPVWFNNGVAISPRDPKNILGTRWIGFHNDIGLHGTIDTNPITEQSTSGCIRLYNRDIEELYKILRVGDKITVTQ